MTKKQETIIRYIRTLPVGAKISTRTIAEALSVSAGTAYKAIKEAESRRLVETRPRAGTFRVGGAATVPAAGMTYESIISCLGLSVLVKGAEADGVPAVIVGDGSLEQLLEERRNTDGSVLCVIGQRPELYADLLQSRISLLITGGGSVGDAAVAQARQTGMYVLSSRQDSAAVLRWLLSKQSVRDGEPAIDALDGWMRKPAYLYYNDLVSDWYRVYESCVSPVSQYAVVDDEQKICGSVDMKDILAAPPFESIDRLYDKSRKQECCVVSQDLSVPEVAEQMIRRDAGVAFAVKDDTLTGILTANDVLRYYVYGAYRRGGRGLPPLRQHSGDDGTEAYYFRLDARNIASPDELLRCSLAAILEAAEACMQDAAGGMAYSLQSVQCRLFPWDGPCGPLEVCISQAETQRGERAVDARIYDERRDYIAMTMTYAVRQA